MTDDRRLMRCYRLPPEQNTAQHSFDFQTSEVVRLSPLQHYRDATEINLIRPDLPLACDDRRKYRIKPARTLPHYALAPRYQTVTEL